EADFVSEVIAGLGQVPFWKMAIKPGRPLAFGRIGGEAGRSAWLFGLPGNPVAVMAAFYQFVRPALWRLMGVDPLPVLALLPAVCTVALKKAPGRTAFQRGVVDPVTRTVRPTGPQGSRILRSICEADCFIVLERERSSVAPGESVNVQLFDGLIRAATGVGKR
ncbi:molybdopterin-binding protein, partial [Accumulibacter sp.]|uniref:molybdopterin-binding protein n=1 Tax=Accumulibacter sp. TaxID=2053492 RepID=UPI0025F2FC3D